MFTKALIVYALFAAPVFAELVVNYTGTDDVPGVDNFKFKAIITNTGDKDVTILNSPNSVLTPKFTTNIFEIVSADGKYARFDGVSMKWDRQGAIDSKDYTVIKAGESIEVPQDVSDVYDFSESGESTYKIDGGSDFEVLDTAGEVSTYVAKVSPHNARISGKLVTPKNFVQSTGDRMIFKRAYAHGCSEDQKTQISASFPYVRTYVSGAISYLKALKGEKPRYAAWFGAWDTGRKNAVLKHYNSINGDVTSAKTTYDCSTCPGSQYSDAYAYVYPNKPYYIYLCGAFWKAPTYGTDSKAGTIVHELSHFTINGGTSDYAYGQSGARALAVSKPDRAILNADSHEYFVENTPRLT